MPRVELLFRALSDRTRLRILHLLADGALCVGDLVAVLGAPQPTVSRHLSYLRRARLVRARRRGLWMFYELAAPDGPPAELLDRSLAASARALPERKRDARRLAAVRRGGGCCPASVREGACQP